MTLEGHGSDAASVASSPDGKAHCQRQPNVRVSYTYDAADRLTRLVNITSTGTTLSSFNYSVDAVSNRIRVIESDSTRVSWSYDNAYQLTRELCGGANSYAATYSYDAARGTTLE